MKEMKSYLKNIILAVLMIGLLIGLGMSLINGIVDVELRKSTYTRTLFDYYIASPDKAQITAIESEASVKCVFPYYVYSKAFSKNENVLLLASDDMADANASLLTEGMLVEGSFDTSGVMLDKTAADALEVEVGDSLSFSLLGQKYTKTVAAIYLPSTYANMEKGIALVEFSADMAATAKRSAYDGAFIVANDRDGVETLLSDYAGEGNVTMSYEEYVDKKCGKKLPNQSQEEFDAVCAVKYAAYRAEVLASAKKDEGQVADKLDAYALEQEKILTTEKKLSNTKLLTMIAAFVVFAVVSILFTVTNAENDRISRDAGMRMDKMLLSYLISSVITALAVALVAGGVLFAIAAGTYFASDCLGVVLSLALPSVVALVPILLAAWIYVKKLYGNSVADA